MVGIVGLGKGFGNAFVEQSCSKQEGGTGVALRVAFVLIFVAHRCQLNANANVTFKKCPLVWPDIFWLELEFFSNQ